MPFGTCRPITETHELAERKLKEMEKVRKAWGIGDDAVEGDAFNRELQVTHFCPACPLSVFM
jgi:hypothetical protein